MEMEKTIDYTKKLPEAEFEVMNAIWAAEPPLTTAYLMEAVGNSKNWKAPTLISFLVRLQERGYIVSEKRGKERYYTPVADKDIYVKSVTADFIEKYHGGSFVNLLNCLYGDDPLSDADIESLLRWLQTQY